ncbi:hypothetical protein K488DRAFT_74723 [Vararia minispora EC-137]|uniref:Uncharacterized protein n=1 Tax=Vararia minispora EC-137 TaxID=1314806 RepID=A0ACB8Q615_9AGAM|nr:hypothetical protein K488DRAFT_74723 [Vararia minispora EC-137]
MPPPTPSAQELDDNGIRALAADLASQPGFIARVEAMSREDIVFAIAMLLVSTQVFTEQCRPEPELDPRSTGSLHWRREGDKVLFSIEADSSDVEVELDAKGAPHKTTLSLKRKASEELGPLRSTVPSRAYLHGGEHADSRANADANADDSPTEYSTSDDADSKLNVDANADDSPTEYSTGPPVNARFKKSTGDDADLRANVDANADDSPTEYSTSEGALQ